MNRLARTTPAGPRTRRGRVAAFAGVALIALGAQAEAATTIGSTLATEPFGTTLCLNFNDETDRGCLAVDEALPGAQLTSPIDGVIVRWRARLGNDTDAQEIRIRVVRRQQGGQVAMISTGELERVPAGAGTYSFPARQPITAGDQIGLEAAEGVRIEWRATLVGARACEYTPPHPPDGGDSASTPSCITNQEHTFNADVEPDADGDGFGDETQDACPTDASTQGKCPAPPTATGSCRGETVAAISGTPGDDSLTGTARAEVIFGVAGDDLLHGLGGPDCLHGEEGADILKGGGGKDLLEGGGNGDQLRGQGGRDELKGDNGADKLVGGEAADKLAGGAGNDKLRGGPATDRLKGSAGNDDINSVDAKRDKVNCGGGSQDKAVVDPIDRVKPNCETVREVERSV